MLFSRKNKFNKYIIKNNNILKQAELTLLFKLVMKIQQKMMLKQKINSKLPIKKIKSY